MNSTAKRYKSAFMQLYEDALEIYRDLIRFELVTDDAINCRLCPFLGADCNGLRDVPPSVCREEIFQWYLNNLEEDEDE